MKKEICENQILRSQMLYFDIPDKQVVFKGARVPGSTQMPPMEIKDVEPAVKVYENAPFGEFSILKIPEFTMSQKTKMVNGEWTKTDALAYRQEMFDSLKTDFNVFL